MFGGSQNQPQPKQAALGMDARRTATNEEARPVPWFCGKQRLGLTFLSDVFHERAVPTYQTQGKQRTKNGDNFYATFAMLAGIGPVDGFHDIFMNDDSVYSSEVILRALSLTGVAGVATFTTTNAHGLTSGDEVIVEGAEQGDYNGSAVATVTGATTFTYPLLGSPTTPATGTITAKIKLDPILRAANPDPVDILIPDYGTTRFYWGTNDQPVDDVLNSSGITHPPYRGISKATFEDLFLGFNQTSVQNIELVLSRQPTAAWHSLGEIDGEANPVAAICDFLQHPFVGIRVRDEQINTARMIEAGEQLADEGLGMSPFVSEQRDAAQHLALMLDHIDGYMDQDEDGLLFIGLNRAPFAPVTITDADTTRRVSFKPQDWSTAYAITEVKFANRERAFKEDIVTHRSPEVFAITGQRTKKTLSFPFFTKPGVARAVAKSAGRINALPTLEGSASLRRSGTLFDDLTPGALFTFDLPTRDTSHLVFRVVDRTVDDSASPEFKITFKVDRSYLYKPPNPPAVESVPITGVGGEEIGGVGGETIEGV